MTRRSGMRPLRIAMIGQKSLPARYGGVETHVENIALRLAERGHHVRAYCRSRLRPAEGEAARGVYRGIELAYRPSIHTQHLDAASHTFLCAAESAFTPCDIVHLHGIGPAAFAPVAGMFGRRVVSTFHALDWRQLKWGTRSKILLRHGERVGARRSDGLIAVSRLMQAHIQSAHGVDAAYIPNGATLPSAVPGTGALERRGLEPGGYVLTVGRIIADRDLHTLIEAFNQSRRPMHLVIVGTETPRTTYSRMLEGMASDRVIFTGDVFGDELQELYAHCLVYCLASRVEGLPITVCEAMAHGRPLLLSDIPENVEVGGDAARYFRCGDVNALLRALEDTVADAPGRDLLSRTARQRAESTYNWDVVADQVESFYYRVMEGSGS